MGSLIRNALRLGLILLLLFQTTPLCAESLGGQVSWIYDGDTIKVEGIGKVRLIGIDAPERENSSRDGYYWKHYRINSERLRDTARDALKHNIAQVKGEEVRLEFDRDRQDKFGRILAYVYLADGTLLNRQLLELGLATVYRRFDFRLKNDFLSAEETARSKGVGLWEK